MKYLDIKTPQNVVVSYELARGLERFLAGLIDLVVLVILGIIASIVTSLFDNKDVISILLFLPILFYTWASEYIFNGLTLGKLALGLRVVHPNKTRLTILDTFGRWVLRLVDIWSTWALVGMILIAGGKKSQRLGDLITNTYVIKTSASRKISLHGLLKIATKKDHEITYDRVRSLLESDMVMIKQTLDRYKQSKNEAHIKAVRRLADKAADRVGADEKQRQDPVKFLRVLLKDYIVLTR